MCPTTFSVMPLPQIEAVRLTHRNTRPSAMSAALVHSSTAALTQSGTGTVRMCLPLPIKSTTAPPPPPPAALAAAPRSVALDLRRLVDGDLCGMFDGETSAAIDLSAPLVSFDLSAVYGSTALPILMACVGAWFQGVLAGDPSTKRIVVLDEAWALLSNLETAQWLRASYKLARSQGAQYLAVLHRLTDLQAAGSADSAQVRLARGLVSDTETVVIYAQHSGEVPATRELLQLNDAEARAISGLGRGVALWRVGRDRKSVV